MKRWVLALMALTLVVAACGGAPTDAGADESGGNIAGACLAGDPDCNDTPGNLPGPPGDDESPPDDDDGTVSSGGVLADGGLTVGEALTTSATGILAVRGYLVDNGVEIRLCEVLAESDPPQCAGESVVVDDTAGLDWGDVQQSGGVTWSSDTVVVFGDLVDGVLVANPNATG